MVSIVFVIVGSSDSMPFFSNSLDSVFLCCVAKSAQAFISFFFFCLLPNDERKEKQRAHTAHTTDDSGGRTNEPTEQYE